MWMTGRLSHHPRAAALALAALCLLAGCGYFAGSPSTPAPTPDGPTGTPTTQPTPSPSADHLGWEAGYSATAPLAVNESDGLNASEREAVVARTMARVELLRGLEFVEPVPVEVVSREAYLERDVRFVRRGDPRVTEQFWEALFLVGEDENATDAVSDLFGGGVVGYYSAGRIVLVSDEANPRVDTGTLAHELVHALQDQHLDRSYDVDTFDARVGTQGLTEGDPVYVERSYRSRCRGEWSCLPAPRGTGADANAIARRPGLYLAFVQPYMTGTGFVEALLDRGGWAAVNDAYADPPRASEQVIHPATYPDERPVEVSVPDRSSANWTRVGRETAGEAGVHVMFWANGFTDRRDDAIRTDYRHRLSTGWDGDALVVYAGPDGDGSSGDVEGAPAGYVWRTVWENETAAREFVRAYRTMLLLRQGAVQVAPGTFLADGESFADAFRVTRAGETVTVVNAPSVTELREVHAPSVTELREVHAP